MNRRRFLQLSCIVPFGTISCKQTDTPAVTKTEHIKVTKTRRHDLDDNHTKSYKGAWFQETTRMRVSAYCACKKCCGKWADGVTASGHKIVLGDKFVAADKIYPFDTMMYIPGYCYISTKGCNYGTIARQVVYVRDRGGAIKGNRIDVYFDTHQEALNWGVQYLDVTVYYVNEKENK